MKVARLTVIMPRRGVAPGFGATEYSTVPLPCPGPPEVIVIQLTVFVALQLQPLPTDTLKLLDPPLEENDLLLGEIEYVHTGEGLVTWIGAGSHPSVTLLEQSVSVPQS